MSISEQLEPDRLLPPYMIATMARENPLWGTERIRGELLKLGIAVSSRSIRRHRRRGHSRPPRQSWRTFLANHSQVIWAADFFVAQTLTFQTLYVLFFISHGSRQLIHFEVTDHPTAAWVWRQLIEATPWNRKPHYLIHDRDRVWGADLNRRTSWLGIKSLRTPIQAPGANAIAERWVRTVRRECLDHLIPLSERHLRATLNEFVHYYNHDRPHRSLGLQPPAPPPRSPHGEVTVRPVLGGLHHVYERLLDWTEFCRPTAAPATGAGFP